MPGQQGKGKPPPLAFTELTCQFAPETRYLPAGKATRYIGGKVELTLSERASEIVCLMRRQAWSAKRHNRPWGKHPIDDKGAIHVKQTPADYERGASYELAARNLATGTAAYAAVDFPPGAESLGWQGTESIRAFPLVRTEDAILLWIRADTGIKGGMIDAVAKAKGKRRDWRMAQPTPGPCAYLLLDNLYPGVEQELTLTITAGATGQTGKPGKPASTAGKFPPPGPAPEGRRQAEINPVATGLKWRWASDSATPPGRTRRKMSSGSPTGSGRRCFA